MAPKPKKDSANVNFRPDVKFRWALWFGQRASGRAKQNIVAEGIMKELDTITLSGKRWDEFWDVEEGVRMVRFLLSIERRKLALDEEELRNFLETFKPFFVDDDGQPNAERLRVLWPHIDELVIKWKKTNRTDPAHIGEAMAVLLKAKGRKVPKEWLDYASVRPA